MQDFIMIPGFMQRFYMNTTLTYIWKHMGDETSVHPVEKKEGNMDIMKIILH